MRFANGKKMLCGARPARPKTLPRTLSIPAVVLRRTRVQLTPELRLRQLTKKIHKRLGSAERVVKHFWNETSRRFSQRNNRSPLLRVRYFRGSEEIKERFRPSEAACAIAGELAELGKGRAKVQCSN